MDGMLRESKNYYLEMLLFAVALPMAFILLGMSTMYMLEPVPEFGGYDHEWSRTIRSIISVLMIAVALKCSQIHRRALGASTNKVLRRKVVVSDSDLCKSAQSAMIAFLVFSAASLVSSLRIFENRFGGGSDAL